MILIDYVQEYLIVCSYNQKSRIKKSLSKNKQNKKESESAGGVDTIQIVSMALLIWVDRGLNGISLKMI